MSENIYVKCPLFHYLWLWKCLRKISASRKKLNRLKRIITGENDKWFLERPKVVKASRTSVTALPDYRTHGIVCTLWPTTLTVRKKENHQYVTILTMTLIFCIVMCELTTVLKIENDKSNVLCATIWQRCKFSIPQSLNIHKTHTKMSESRALHYYLSCLFSAQRDRVGLYSCVKLMM